ncbi:MAG TPA: SIS domain-containing protein, partial [Actinomycetota bacterium]
NEVEGWSAGSGTPFATIVLRHGGEHPKVGRRVVASLEAIAPAALDTREVLGKGFGPLESLFSLVMMGDFVSIYLGVLRGVDPLAIPVLSGLKERLRE